MRELGAGVDSLARQTLVPATATCEPTGTIHSAEPLSLGVFLLVGLGGAHCLGMRAAGLDVRGPDAIRRRRRR